MIFNSNIDEMIVNEIAAKELVLAVENYKTVESELKDAEFKYHQQDIINKLQRKLKIQHQLAHESRKKCQLMGEEEALH